MNSNLSSNYINWSHYINQGLVDILGHKEAQSVLENGTAGLVNKYSPDAVSGIGVLAGRAAFKYWLRENYLPRKWDQSEIRMQPTRKKLQSGIADLCNWLSEAIRANFTVTNQGDCWEIEVPSSNGIFTDAHSIGGFFQEFTSWVDQGKFYPVKYAVVFLDGKTINKITIPKKPLD
jgi:hypothetical protein